MGENGERTLAIGIDLGTTYSCVAVYREGNVNILANNEGHQTTPSVVAFRGKEVEISMQAKREAMMNTKNTIFGIKRLIGRKFNDKEVQEDIKNWPFTVVNVEGEPFVEVESEDKLVRLSPVEISAYILKHMKKIAEPFIGNVQKAKAVITVPAYFNNAQREATKQAGILAGLEVMQILNEPTAAGIAYGHQHQNEQDRPRKLFIFDFGGGTFDVSILSVDKHKFKVLGTAGNNHLGGEDVDNAVVKHFTKIIQDRHKIDITGNPRAMSKLRAACEAAKKVLTCNNNTNITVDSLGGNIDFQSPFSRTMFDDINREIYEKLKEPIGTALNHAKLKPENIDDVILVGGSTKILYIQEMVREIFKRDPCKDINPDEAVAYGAAILAANLLDPGQNQFSVEDVTPVSLGIATAGGKMSPVIKTNSPIPASESQMFTTNYDDQIAINFAIYEGDRPLIAENHYLGEFLLKDIPPSPREVPKIRVDFSIDRDGILNVTAEQVNTGQMTTITVQADQDKWTPEKLAQMSEDMELFKEEDEMECQRIDAKLALEEFCLDIISKSKKSFNAPKHVRDTLNNQCQEKLDWLADNRDASLEDYLEIFEKLKKDCADDLIRLAK